MSAPLAIELERELGNVRSDEDVRLLEFSSVSAVVRWYRARRETKEGRAIDLASSRGPQSGAERAVAAIAYARIVPCLAPRHHADYDGESLAVNALDAIENGRKPVETPDQEAVRRLSELTAWCEALEGETAQANISDRLNFKSVEGCSSYMRYTMRVLRRRFVAVGLLVEGD